MFVFKKLYGKWQAVRTDIVNLITARGQVVENQQDIREQFCVWWQQILLCAWLQVPRGNGPVLSGWPDGL